MKKKHISPILKEVLERVNPDKEEIKIIENSLDKFLKKVEKRLKSLRINAEIFVGGSFAKGTMIKRDFYDIDIFVRFDKRYKNDELSRLTKKLLKGMKNVSKIHGSRDYFRISVAKWLVFEVVPVRKIKNFGEAENITDRSYSHVHYIKRKMKNKKIMDDIRLAKAFCHANNCYGAESYVNGFSGYALELLIYKYKSFLSFIKAMSKIKGKEIIDLEKHYKNKNQIMMDINASKLKSPIILIDPTFKQRNALAALSDETFRKFQKACRDFLKNPSIRKFDEKILNFEKIKKDAKRKKYEFVLLTVKTGKQEGDVAGSKLGKFYKHLGDEIEKFFDVKNRGFSYGGKKSAIYFFVVKKKKEILIKGPLLKQREHVKRFKRKHKKTFTKKERIYSKENINFNLKKFIRKWKMKNKGKMREMSIIGFKVVL